MVNNTLYWVRTDNVERYLYDRLYAKRSIQEYPKNWLMEEVNENKSDDKAFSPKVNLFMKLIQSDYNFVKSGINIPISFSAEQLAFNNMYNEWKSRVKPYVNSYRKFNIEDYIVKPAKELFGDGDPIKNRELTQQTL